MTNNNAEKDTYSDEAQLDKLFGNVDSNSLTRVINRAKWNSLLKTLAISAVTIGVVWTVGTIMARELVYRMETPIQIAVDGFNYISAPNKYIGKVTRYHDTLGGKNIYTTYKLIEGKVVYTGDEEYSYGIMQPDSSNSIGSESPSIIGQSYSEEDVKTSRYNQLGQREMVFFYPFVDYQVYHDDLALLDQIGSGKYVEMALSFDKPYSLDEISKLLPNKLTAAWYWVDDLSQQEKESHKPRKEEIKDEQGNTKTVSNGDVRSERTAYGFKAYDANGEPFDDLEGMFIGALNNGLATTGKLKGNSYGISRYKGEFQRVHDNIAGQDGKLTKDDLRVQGIVVTGDVEKLKPLRGLTFIKASSLGVVTDKF